MKPLFLCAISNISSGNCSEDCAFCTQSHKVKNDFASYKLKSEDEILHEALKAYQNKALGFCMVSSGRKLKDEMVEYLSKLSFKIRSKYPLMLIANNGIATYEQLRELKKNGFTSYNHNLECAKSYYDKICTTHSFDERFTTCENVKKAELLLCCGGIYGVGETKEQRAEFQSTLASLKPFTSTINFFTPHKSLKISPKAIEKNEALKIIKDTKASLPETLLMLAAGRERIFKEDFTSFINAGIDAIIIGDYLNTKGEKASKDLDILNKLQIKIADKCFK